MKNYIFCFAACIVAALSLSSCNKEDNNKLTPEDISYIISETTGSYSGKIITYSDYNDQTNRYDTADTTYTSVMAGTDTVVTISTLPVKRLADMIKTAENKPLKDALTEAVYVNAYGKYIPAAINPAVSILLPSMEFQLLINGMLRTVTLTMADFYSFGQVNPVTKKLAVQLLPASIFIDGEFAETILPDATAPGLMYFFN